jgi:hypothetical protein
LTSPLADGATSPIDQGVATFLFLAAFLLGWIAYARLRGKGFRSVPRAGAWAAAVLALASVVMAVALPPIIRHDPATTRPSTVARLAILSPQPGEVFEGNPAIVEVRLDLTGGKIVLATSTTLVLDEGHVHLFLDGSLVSMTYGLMQELDVAPGTHTIDAEFVALDHAPFNPRVRTSVTFTVQA